MSIPLPAVASMKPCLIQVEYGTRHTRSSSATRSLGIQKKGSSVQASPPSNGGKTNTTAVSSVVQEASTPAQHGLARSPHLLFSRSTSYSGHSRMSTPPPHACHFAMSITGSSRPLERHVEVVAQILRSLGRLGQRLFELAHDGRILQEPAEVFMAGVGGDPRLSGLPVFRVALDAFHISLPDGRVERVGV